MKIKGMFVAHVAHVIDEKQQGLVYIRLIDSELRNSWVRVMRNDEEPGLKYDAVYFGSLEEALNDARSLARCGAWAVETDQSCTPFNDNTIQVIVDFLRVTNQLKVA